MENIIFSVAICTVITGIYMAIEDSGQKQPLHRGVYWVLHKSKMRHSPGLRVFV